MRRCIYGRNMKHLRLLWTLVCVLSLPLAAQAGGGGGSGCGGQAEPTVPTSQTPGVAHSCKQDLHTAACIEHCKKNVTTAQTPGVAHDCKKEVHSPSCVKRCQTNLSTAETEGVTHVCTKEVHDLRCVKKCVANTTKVGAPLPWYVRYGAASPRRDKQAEQALLDGLYEKHMKASNIKSNKEP